MRHQALWPPFPFAGDTLGKALGCHVYADLTIGPFEADCKVHLANSHGTLRNTKLVGYFKGSRDST